MIVFLQRAPVAVRGAAQHFGRAPRRLARARAPHGLRIGSRVVLMASSEGGMDIEEVAESHPELLHSIAIDPSVGLTDAEADAISTKIGVPAESIADARVNLQGLYKAYWETDSSLAEINPLILTGSGKVIALDAKFNFEDRKSVV